MPGGMEEGPFNAAPKIEKEPDANLEWGTSKGAPKTDQEREQRDNWLRSLPDQQKRDETLRQFDLENVESMLNRISKTLLTLDMEQRSRLIQDLELIRNKYVE